jgi:hypothetical protein
MHSKALHLSVFDDRYRTLLTGVFDDLGLAGNIHKYGKSCFVMAGLVAKILESEGIESRIHACYAVVRRDEQLFTLGFRDAIAGSDQLDGHVVCVAEQRILVDFGLGNVRRYGWPDFWHAIACEIQPGKTFPVSLVLSESDSITWFDGSKYHGVNAIMDELRPVIESAFLRYRDMARTAAQSDGTSGSATH